MTEYLSIIIFWVLYIFAQSMIINGVRIAASGTTEKKPDGTDKDSEMILYPITKFLMQHSMRRVYYGGREFEKLILEIKKKYEAMMPSYLLAITRDGYIGLKTDSEQALGIMVDIAKKVEHTLGVKFEVIAGVIHFYKEYKKYRFNKYLRLPTLGCIRCMSSYWSVFTYWLPMVWYFGFEVWMVPVWFANITSVTFVNTFIAQRYQE